MAIVPKNKYRPDSFEPKVYNFISGKDLEIDVPYDGEAGDVEISISITAVSDGCNILRGYIVSSETTIIPGGITSRMNGNYHGIILIRDKNTNKNKTIRIGLYEEKWNK